MYNIYLDNSLFRVLTYTRLVIATEATPVNITKRYKNRNTCCMRSPYPGQRPDNGRERALRSPNSTKCVSKTRDSDQNLGLCNRFRSVHILKRPPLVTFFERENISDSRNPQVFSDLHIYITHTQLRANMTLPDETLGATPSNPARQIGRLASCVRSSSLSINGSPNAILFMNTLCFGILDPAFRR
jgi:hypothetical protein